MKVVVVTLMAVGLYSGFRFPSDPLLLSCYIITDLKLNGEDGGGPTYITIMERPVKKISELMEEEEDDDDDSREARKRQQQREKQRKKSPPASHELKDKLGSVDHHVQQDSEISICIRASMAGSKNPMRFGLRVEELTEEEVESEDMRKQQQNAETGSGETADVDEHLSRMETQLKHIEHLMHAMIKNADMVKEIDALYHRHTDAMYKATAFWPFVHVGILLVTGFTQVNHIVQFFKKHRII